MKRKAPLPRTQVQEVLYELIHRFSIDRRSMMLQCGVWNLPARILDLRRLGLIIKSQAHTVINAYGREVTFMSYAVKDRKEAIKLYKRLQKCDKK